MQTEPSADRPVPPPAEVMEPAGGGAEGPLLPDTPPAVNGAAVASDLDAVGPEPTAADDAFPVVGVGASAGGLRAIREFISALPPRPEMAFVLVQHLSPSHESTLAGIVQQETEMEVTQVTGPVAIGPNRVYVIPPGKHLEVDGGVLRLVEPARHRGVLTAVNHFFRTLARDASERAVAVILSGTGEDGSLGLGAVKERGGLTLAQDPDSAEHDGMPRSAVATGHVDLVGSPAELAERLVEVRRSADRLDVPEPDERPAIVDEQALRSIFAHLRQQTGHDFTHYKRSTILRRIARRLQVNGIGSIPDYAGFLRGHPAEAEALLRDFLISVTQFFRDLEAFAALEREALPSLFEEAGDTVRVWVAGCATGEEAYSLAMLLAEHADRHEPRPEIQVFATDLDEQALTRAREGVYPKSVAADLSAERVDRFFDRTADGLRVKPWLREHVLFAPHNLVADPPFSRIDLVSCRNVLIYFNRAIQERAFAAFHYALRPDGVLFLGSSETPDTVTDGFAEVDRSVRIYRRRDVRLADKGFPLSMTARAPAAGGPGTLPDPTRGVLDRYRDWTLSRYAPPRLLVDERHNVTHVFGRAGDYLREREGPVTQNAVDKVLGAFRVDLRAALAHAFEGGGPTDTAFRAVDVGGEQRLVRLHVGRVGGDAAQDGLAEVVFIELDPASVEALGAPPVVRAENESAAVAELESELRSVRDLLQAKVEEHEVANEELKSSNEELQSVNEELQSTTEELETSKEELQSLNEELSAVNQELKVKVDELTRANADLHNLIGATEVAAVFLDRDLRVKRYTPAAAGLFDLAPHDVGRPFAHVTHRLAHDGLDALAARVLDTLIPAEQTVANDGDDTFLLRALPYRTADDHIDGVVLTFVDVTEVERAKRAAAVRAAQQSIVADLGTHALEGAPAQSLFDEAVARVRAVLHADACKVLCYEPERKRLRLVSGVGWSDGLVGAATVPDDARSQAGYTLLARQPVLVTDLGEETRFEGPPLLTDHGLQSGMSVTIPSSGPTPYGVFGVHSREPRVHSADDGLFLQGVANVLAGAVEQERQAQTIRQQLSEIEGIYRTAPIGLGYLDADLRFVRINAVLAEQINGRTIEAHLGQRFPDVLPEVAAMVEPILRGVLETGQAVKGLEVRGTTRAAPDDERVWLCVYYPETDGGEVVGISMVIRDVTARKRQEEALARTAAQLETALAGGRLGVWSIDLATGQATLSGTAARLFDLDRQFPLESIFERVHPDDRGALRDVLLRATDPGADGVYETTYRFRQAGGRYVWVSARGRTRFEADGPAPRPVQVDGVLVDVTDLKEAEETVRRQLGEIESYFDAVPTGIAILDERGRYVRVNRRMGEITGRLQTDLVGERPELLFPAYAGDEGPYIDHVLATGEFVSGVEVRAPAPSAPDEPRDWLKSFQPVFDGPDIVGVSVVVHDVTAMKRAQADLEGVLADLEGRVEERTAQVRKLSANLTEAEQRERRRVAQVLHDDLQQMLYALQFKLQLVERTLTGTAEEAGRALAQAEGLLAEAIQATRTLTVDLSPPVLRGEGLEGTLEWLAVRMEEAYGLRVHVESAGPVAVGSTMHTLLFQLIRELLFNVVKHAETDEAWVHVSREGGDVCVEVVDEGTGFDPEGASDQSGFGLFSVRERIQLVGGRVDVASSPGRGTRATIVCSAQA